MPCPSAGRIVLILCALAAGAASTCTSLTQRKDWRALTDAERDNFITAQQTLWKQSIDPVTNFSVYDRNFTLLHRTSAPYAHQTPQFLPWHRRFLRDYEVALRTIDPSVSLPYWNWAEENYPHFNQSLLWDDRYFGGDGDESDPKRCVKTGRYANWILNIGGDVKDFNVNVAHCLRRVWNRGINVYFPPGKTLPLPSFAEIASNITSFNGNFTLFRMYIEGPHGTVHFGVGGGPGGVGDMSAVENSPNEPIFWLHHTFVDYIWWKFQQSTPAARSAYGGLPFKNANPLAATDVPATLNDTMLAWDVSVESAFYTDSDDYCYTY